VGTGVGESIIVGDGDGNDGVMVAAAAAVDRIDGRSLGVGKDATRIRYALRDGLMWLFMNPVCASSTDVSCEPKRIPRLF